MRSGPRWPHCCYRNAPEWAAHQGHRLIVEAIVWLDRTGAPWRDLPSQFGPWETVASRFYRWRRQGIWDRVLAALQADS